MIHGKRVVSFLLVLVMCLGLALQVQASELNETRDKASELEGKKKKAEDEKASLAEQLNTIVADMEETQSKIDAKEDELEVKEEELEVAKAEENDQYESMKMRIKYMYENGDIQFMEILCESKSIGEFLNTAEYITTISEYDREMLVEFQEVVKKVEEQEAALKEEYAQLETMQNDLISKQEEVDALVSEKEAEISQLDSELKETNDKLAKLEAAAAEAQRRQNESGSGYNPGGAGGSVVSGNGAFTHPCLGYTRISSEFGWRPQPLPGASTNHKGIDFAAPTGTPIYAAAGGTVTSAGYSGNAGRMITINHGNGLITMYMHCSELYVSSGQKVSKGQNIAAVGSTGNSTGPHLHFQVMLNGTPQNPHKYL